MLYYHCLGSWLLNSSFTPWAESARGATSAGTLAACAGSWVGAEMRWRSQLEKSVRVSPRGLTAWILGHKVPGWLLPLYVKAHVKIVRLVVTARLRCGPLNELGIGSQAPK